MGGSRRHVCSKITSDSGRPQTAKGNKCLQKMMSKFFCLFSTGNRRYQNGMGVRLEWVLAHRMISKAFLNQFNEAPAQYLGTTMGPTMKK